MTELNNSNIDRLTSVAKGVVGVCPYIGPLISEAIGQLIPNQRFDRVVYFLCELEKEVGQRLEKLEHSIKTPEGLDLFEEGIVQTARSISLGRQKKLARITGRALTAEKIKYAESKKFLIYLMN